MPINVLGYAAHTNTSPLAPFHFQRRDPLVDDVVIQVLFYGVCHSDLHMACNDWGITTYPIELCQKLEAPASELFFSVASFSEIAIKNSLGREDFQINISLLRRGLLEAGYNELPILSSHVMHIQNVPMIHKDPFDRVLIAQAFVEGIILFTSDVRVAKYSGSILLV